MKKILSGINIQYPISRLIVNGSKTIETRTYPIPQHYVGQELYLIETPGKSKEFRARVVAVIKFGSSFKYSSKAEFKSDFKRHQVTPESEWDWVDKPKWGWPIVFMKPLKSPREVEGPRGIRFTKSVLLK